MDDMTMRRQDCDVLFIRGSEVVLRRSYQMSSSQNDAPLAEHIGQRCRGLR